MLIQTKEFDVAILGWWYGKNYGSVMTYYALNRAVMNLGHKVLMVHEPLGYNGYRVKWPDDIFSMQFAKRVGYAHTVQEHYSEISKLNQKANTFIVGSDQLWNPHIGRVNDDLFLDFVSDENKRIAYATSFGNRDTTKFKPDFIAKHTENLKKFDAISVREDYAVDISNSVFGVSALQVVDPVFLLPASEYALLAENATVKPQDDYLLIFFLDPDLHKSKVARYVAEKLGLKKIVVIPNPDKGLDAAKQFFSGENIEILEEAYPENFLYAYKNSQYVLTDSFHGSAFAAIFEKPFSSIYNTKRGADRFVNLMNLLGFGEDRRIYENASHEDIMSNKKISLEINYSMAKININFAKEKSKTWLKNALSAIKKTQFTSPIVQSEVITKIDRPNFLKNNDAWVVNHTQKTTKIRISAADVSVRGNHVWCDLPIQLRSGYGYKVTVDWLLQTTARAVNLHLRNSETGNFIVGGAIPSHGNDNQFHRDSVSFFVNGDGYNQIMFGAIHFVGPEAGAEISSIVIESLSAADTGESKSTSPKGKSPLEVAKALSQSDHERFVGAYAINSVPRNSGNSRAIMMFHSHGYEKGLSRKDNFRPGFGQATMPKFAQALNKWVEQGRSTKDSFFRISASVLHTYFERHRKLGVDVSHFFRLFSPAVQEEITKSDGQRGGVLPARSDREPEIYGVPERSFVDVVYGRRSVREFTAQPVSDVDIENAVRVALQAPSVCNRQPGRVHQIDDPKLIEAAVELQGGFRGYEPPPKLLLVTSDLTAFIFAVERNQAFIDGGLFMMTLLLGLEQVGLGACPLNTAMSNEKEDKVRKLLNIPESEVLIAFIAVGHFDQQTLIPRSKRLPIEEILVKHN